MSKKISNQQYNEFWNDETLEVKNEEDKSDKKVSSEEIKKIEKKIGKKISNLEKGSSESDETKIEPVNKPRGWHAKNRFVDDIGNVFEKGEYVGKEEKPKIQQKKEEKPKTIKDEPPTEVFKPVQKTTPEISLYEKDLKRKSKKQMNKPIPRILTNKQKHQQYIDEGLPFRMYFRGNLIFDSSVQPRSNFPKFQDDGFILFGKNYIYRGIRIEKY